MWDLAKILGPNFESALSTHEDTNQIGIYIYIIYCYSNNNDHMNSLVTSSLNSQVLQQGKTSKALGPKAEAMAMR